MRKRPAHWPVIEVANRSSVVFLTVCVQGRRPLLANTEIHALLDSIWRCAGEWVVGRYILMPDHVHLFCAPASGASGGLKAWVSFWKSQASKAWPRADEKPVWQRDFWDRQLRTGEGYSGKWDYVRNNPVRAGLCRSPDEWRYQGEIVEFRFHDA